MLRKLESEKILATLERLQQRVRRRFPDAGLNTVVQELLVIGRDTELRTAQLQSPHRRLRIAVAALIVLLLATLVGVAITVRVQAGVENLSSLMQGLEATVNDLVFIGVAVWFLATIETRIKRRRALRGIHELRVAAHVVDMHQLTKDPAHSDESVPLPAGAPRRLTRPELAHYLDYCSELLSIVSKLAALYVQTLEDPAVLAAVNEVQGLTTGLSNKIWQKIMILDTSPSDGGKVRAPARES